MSRTINLLKNCHFCRIAKGQDEDNEIIKRNDELVCFSSNSPDAPLHFLVIPIKHIHSCYSLHKGHVGLVERMSEMAKDVLRDHGITDEREIRLGFHKPPYNSVDHLHLHAVAPVSQMRRKSQSKFAPDSAKFVTAETLQKCIRHIETLSLPDLDF